MKAGETGRVIAVRTFIDGMRAHRELVLAGGTTAATALSLARDLERALIENQALRTVAFDDPAWQGYLRQIIDETRDHQQRIEARLGREVAPTPQRE